MLPVCFPRGERVPGRLDDLPALRALRRRPLPEDVERERGQHDRHNRHPEPDLRHGTETVTETWPIVCPESSKTGQGPQARDPESGNVQPMEASIVMRIPNSNAGGRT